MQVADNIGLPTDEGLFGFKPFPEVSALPGCSIAVKMHLDEQWRPQASYRGCGFCRVDLCVSAIGGIWNTHPVTGNHLRQS